jgi:hypothetical protein
VASEGIATLEVTLLGNAPKSDTFSSGKMMSGSLAVELSIAAEPPFCLQALSVFDPASLHPPLCREIVSFSKCLAVVLLDSFLPSTLSHENTFHYEISTRTTLKRPSNHS